MELVRITVDNIDDLDLVQEILQIYLKEEQRKNLLPITCQIHSQECINHVFAGRLTLDVPTDLADRIPPRSMECSFPFCQLSVSLTV